MRRQFPCGVAQRFCEVPQELENPILRCDVWRARSAMAHVQSRPHSWPTIRSSLSAAADWYGSWRPRPSVIASKSGGSGFGGGPQLLAPNSPSLSISSHPKTWSGCQRRGRRKYSGSTSHSSAWRLSKPPYRQSLCCGLPVWRLRTKIVPIPDSIQSWQESQQPRSRLGKR